MLDQTFIENQNKMEMIIRIKCDDPSLISCDIIKMALSDYCNGNFEVEEITENKRFDGGKPMDGKDLEVLKKTQKRLFSQVPTSLTSCSCDNGLIDCPGCKDVDEKDRMGYMCASCHGKNKVTCGKCGGKSK